MSAATICPHCGRDNTGYEGQPCSDDCPQYWEARGIPYKQGDTGGYGGTPAPAHEDCPNCFRRVEPDDLPKQACMLEAALAVILDRGIDPAQARAWWLQADADAVWGFILGPAVDEIQQLIEAFDVDAGEADEDE